MVCVCDMNAIAEGKLTVGHSNVCRCNCEVMSEGNERKCSGEWGKISRLVAVHSAVAASGLGWLRDMRKEAVVFTSFASLVLPRCSSSSSQQSCLSMLILINQ